MAYSPNENCCVECNDVWSVELSLLKSRPATKKGKIFEIVCGYCQFRSVFVF
jgi:hypothetical protein